MVDCRVTWLIVSDVLSFLPLATLEGRSQVVVKFKETFDRSSVERRCWL